MVDKVRKTTKSKSKQAVKGISSLIEMAMKAKAGYDYPAALELFDRAQSDLHKLSQVNGSSDSDLLEYQYIIHDGRADCHNWLADWNLELDELKIMEALSIQMGDESRRINVINRQSEALFGLGDYDAGERLSLLGRDLARDIGDLNE
jgi:hypothetical protein